MPPQHHLPELETQRDRLYSDLAQLGDFRPGSLTAVRRRCGKPNCACADPDHPGHGPQLRLTKRVEGKTVTITLKPGAQLEKTQREVAAYKRFRGLVDELVEVNEQICEARPAGDVSPAAAGPGDEKGGPSGRRSRPRSPRR